jgi:hypothetical protein
MYFWEWNPWELTNSVELRPSGEVANLSATQEFPKFMESEGSLPCSQEPASSPYTQPNKSSPYLTPSYLSKIHFNPPIYI